ncbi:hypothetical protein, partial [Campylobacter jejuni]
KENIVILPKKLLSKDWKNLSKEIFNDKK